MVVKNTVLPGITEDVVVPAIEGASGCAVGKEFEIMMNAEFLRKGTAVEDFLHPQRIVFGTRDESNRQDADSQSGDPQYHYPRSKDIL